MPAVLIILVAILFSVTGQIFLKTGLNIMGPIDFSSGFILTYFKIFLSPYVMVGVFTYVLSVLFWVYALSKVDLSFAYPFVALSYVLILITSKLFLGETIPMIRWIGVFVICIGVILISRS